MSLVVDDDMELQILSETIPLPLMFLVQSHYEVCQELNLWPAGQGTTTVPRLELLSFDRAFHWGLTERVSDFLLGPETRSGVEL